MPQMHPDQVMTSDALARRLVASQFPQWAHLPVVAIRSMGTDHDIYRLGENLAIRLPKIAWAEGQARFESVWLPRLAPRLPLAVPEPLALGEPEGGYPFAWSIYRWLPGRDLTIAHIEQDQLAHDLAEFIGKLREAPTDEAPPLRRAARGAPLRELDGAVRKAIDELGDRINGRAALAEWGEALQAKGHTGPGAWIHGDLLPGNLLASGERLHAVIDFGTLGVGDPACDLQPAWHVFDRRTREDFLRALGAGADARQRGRGWVLAQTTIALPYYWETNQPMVQQSLAALGRLLGEPDSS